MGHARTAAHRPKRIELRLAQGSIVAADARAIVLGVFPHVDPAGAAAAVDTVLGGAIRDLTLRRMFSARLGQVSVLPCAGHGLRARCVLLAGLGDFDELRPSALSLAAENALRMMTHGRIDDFATVLFGAGSGIPVATALEHQLRGFIDGVRAAGRRRPVRRITLCEIDPRKYAALIRAAGRLAPSIGGDDVELVLEPTLLPRAGDTPPRKTPLPHRTRAQATDPVYLLVSMRDLGRGGAECRCSLLTAGAKAAVLSGTVVVPRGELQRVFAPVTQGTLDTRDLPRLGQQLARLLLAANVRDGLESMASRPVVVVHDREASQVPWETLHVGGAHPALARGMSRRYESETLTAARWRESQTADARLKVLLIANPTGDLPGAAAEARELARMFATKGTSLERLEGPAATHTRVLARLAAERFDVLHFAGHAFFDADDPGRSGLLCAGDEVLSGADLAQLAHLPALVFCNACEAARVRRPWLPRARAVRPTAGIAEAFLAGGVANFLGTHWPVGDLAALEFSTQLYRDLLGGTLLGEAILAGRRRVAALDSIDWADYVHYGTPQFQLGNPDH